MKNRKPCLPHQNGEKRPFDLILFDLGGVLVKLSGVAQMLAWAKDIPSETELWQRWLTSRAVRRFESGQSSPARFASAVIDEFNLSVTADAFLAAFAQWPRTLYPGTGRLLDTLKHSYRLGVLSNTNEIHWHRFETKMTFLRCFDCTFPSFRTGRLKPDPDTFRFVAKAAGHPPARILFLDDSPLNVASAVSTGMTAHTVSGVKGAREKLYALRLMKNR